MRIRTTLKTVTSAAGRLARSALLLPLLLTGYLAGLAVRLARLAWAAIIEGYELGRRM